MPHDEWTYNHEMYARGLDCLLANGEDAIVRADRDKAADMFYELIPALVVYRALAPCLNTHDRTAVTRRIGRVYIGCAGTLLAGV
jgi:hypothetical protein